MEEKKFKLIKSDKEGLFRVLALRDFSDVKAGDIGGYVKGEYNLSHKGLCWIYDDAIVRSYAVVSGDAKVYGNANVSDNAIVCGNASVHGNAQVYDYASVFGYAEVSDNAKVFGNADVYGKAKVCGDARVYGNADICGDAVLKDESDYLVFSDILNCGMYMTYTRSNNMWRVGGFYGSGEELIKFGSELFGELNGKKYEATINYVKELLKD